MTVIEQLAEIIRPVPNVSMEYNAKQMLLTVQLGGHRKQTVRIVTLYGRSGQPFIKMQSRAALLKDHRLVRQAIESNGTNQLTAFAIDGSCQPPALDVTYGLPVADLYPQELIDALFFVASRADAIEQRLSKVDQF